MARREADIRVMGITFFPENGREAELLGKVRAVEAHASALERENVQLRQELALTRDQNRYLLEENFQWRAERARLRGEIARLEVRVADLARGARRTSRNSHQPPSTDRPRRPRRKPTGRSRGAQPGHPGVAREGFAVVDRHVELPVETCGRCGNSLADVPAQPGRLHQVAEWVSRPVEVVEYHHPVKCCPHCRARVEAPYPDGVLPGSHVGPRLIAMWGLFNRWGFTSIEKLAHLFTEDFGLPMPAGSIENGLLRLHAALREPYDELGRALKQAPLLHIDETGWWVRGREHRVWGLATEDFGYFAVSRHKNREFLESLIGPADAFSGVVVTDFYDVYNVYGGQRCLAHLRRELEALAEEPDAECRVFAGEVVAFLDRGYALWRAYEQGPDAFTASREAARQLREECRAFLNGLPERVPDPVRLLRTRMRDYEQEIWYFLDHPGVPPDNNLVERALRPIVTYRKVSGGSQSDWGAELTVRVHTVLDTCRKQGRDPVDFMVQALLASARPDHYTFPSLLASEA
jgi:transposase